MLRMARGGSRRRAKRRPSAATAKREVEIGGIAPQMPPLTAKGKHPIARAVAHGVERAREQHADQE